MPWHLKAVVVTVLCLCGLFLYLDWIWWYALNGQRTTLTDGIVTILHPIKNVTLWPLCAKSSPRSYRFRVRRAHHRPTCISSNVLVLAWRDSLIESSEHNTTRIPSTQQNQTPNHNHLSKWSHSLKASISSCLDPPKLEFLLDSQSKTGWKSPYMYHFCYPPWRYRWSSLYRVNFLH